MTTLILPKEWFEGRDAYPAFDCPYPPGSPERQDWLDGWAEAHDLEKYGEGPWGFALQGPEQ